MKKNETFLSIREGERKREDLFLPILHYPTVDPLNDRSWITDLGPKTFVAWLQLLTLVDRRKTALDVYGNQNTVPRSLEGLAKVLGMSKPTLYKVVIKPLWNFGFIDLVEWTDQKKIGTKAINIIVYPYPQNDKSLENKPLTQVRDYDIDYSSDAKTFSQKAAQIRSGIAELDDEENIDLINRKEMFTVDREETFTVESKAISSENTMESNRKENFTVEGEESFTLTVKEPLPNNKSNTLVNKSNTQVNKENTFISEEEEEENSIYTSGEKIEDLYIEAACQHLKEIGFDDNLIQGIKNELEASPKFAFTITDVDKQLAKMKADIDLGKQIYNYEKYFVGGLQQISQKHLFGNIKVPQEPIRKSINFYNWLEERE